MNFWTCVTVTFALYLSYDMFRDTLRHRLQIKAMELKAKRNEDLGDV